MLRRSRFKPSDNRKAMLGKLSSLILGNDSSNRVQSVYLVCTMPRCSQSKRHNRAVGSCRKLSLATDNSIGVIGVIGVIGLIGPMRNLLNNKFCLTLYNSKLIKMKEAGYVYILTNPSFKEDWVKIGKSSRPVDIRSKELDNTAVPLPFEIYATLKTVKFEDVERQLHRMIDRLTDLRIRPNREFFNVPPTKALELLKDCAMTIDDAVIDEVYLTRSCESTNNIPKRRSKRCDVKALDLYFIKAAHNANAIGHKTANGFVVHSGSIISNAIAPSIPSSLANKRKALIDEGVIVNDIFVADYQFNSASTSAGVVLGRSANGLIEWKDANGSTLKSKM